MGEELKKLEDYVKNHPELDFQEHVFVSHRRSNYYESVHGIEIVHGIAVAPEARRVLLVAGDTRMVLPFSSILSVDFKGEVILKPDRKSQWIIAGVGVVILLLLAIGFADSNIDFVAFAALGSLVLSAMVVGMLTVQQRVKTDTRTAGLRIGTDDFENPVIDVVFVPKPEQGYTHSNMSISESMEAAQKWYGRLRAIVAGQGDAEWTFKKHPRVEWKAFP